MAHPTHTAIGTWSGGRFMHFGEPLDDERLLALFRPGDDIRTVMTADAYGAGEADTMLGRALAGVPRDEVVVVGAIGHDFYEGERQGSKGFPRFTDPALRGPEGYADYIRMATERSLERIGIDRFDLLMLHNPDRTGYTSEAVWDGLSAVQEDGLTDLLGIAPGPANGYTLDLLDSFERFGDRIDWAMVILNPLEPWPGSFVIDPADEYNVRLITRVVDYGGLFWDDVASVDAMGEHDHRRYRPEGWVEAGHAKLDVMRAIAARHDLTLLQLAASWNLAHESVQCVAPTLIQERADPANPVTSIEAKRAQLAGVPERSPLTADEVELLGELGDNTGCMALKGAAPDYDGPVVADRWPIDEELHGVAGRHAIAPEILAKTM
jgi:aryl-alcohol dehydrogenase-like predicted oxidoreductase